MCAVSPKATSLIAGPARLLYDSVRKTLKIVTDGGSFELPEAAAKLIADKIMAKIRQTSGT
jgi:dihydroneopterin aldolase